MIMVRLWLRLIFNGVETTYTFKLNLNGLLLRLLTCLSLR